jgi:hypothetical protein
LAKKNNEAPVPQVAPPAPPAAAAPLDLNAVELTIVLPAGAVNVILKALQKQPFEEVAGVIQAVKMQGDQQFDIARARASGQIPPEVPVVAPRKSRRRAVAPANANGAAA